MLSSQLHRAFLTRQLLTISGFTWSFTCTTSIYSSLSFLLCLSSNVQMRPTSLYKYHFSFIPYRPLLRIKASIYSKGSVKNDFRDPTNAHKNDFGKNSLFINWELATYLTRTPIAYCIQKALKMSCTLPKYSTRQRSLMMPGISVIFSRHSSN